MSIPQTGLLKISDIRIVDAAAVHKNIVETITKKKIFIEDTELNGGLTINTNKFTVDINGNTYVDGTLNLNASLLNANGGIAINTNKFTVDTNGNTYVNGTQKINGNVGIGNDPHTIAKLFVEG